jgi:membrane protein YqaA with SNARE-associated domain
VYGIVLWVQEVLVPFLGPAGLFVAAFLDSSFLSLPEINDLLVVTSASARPEMAWFAITMATLGSLSGCSVLWWLGRRGGEALLVKRFGPERTERTRAAFRRFGVLALAVPALLPPPMPFKIFVLSAGVFAFPFRRFLLTLVLARGFRYAFWGVMGLIYEDEALNLLRAIDHWTATHALLLLALVGLLVSLGLALYLRRRTRPDAGVGGVR